MQYELFYLVGESNKPNLEKIKEEVKKIVSEEGGKFFELQVIKERKMSYKVKDEVRGIYIAQRFEIADRDSENSNPEAISNITKKMNLNSDVLRFIIVNAEELPELKIKEREEKISKPAVTRKKTEVRAKKAEEKKELVKEKEAADEDIDKKLEEILKI